MTLFYDALIDLKTKEFTFNKEESKHIAKVLRKSSG
ncbi:MAG: 16S rRNA (uracil(1498)-N(3))-methyltransferase, partial [Flavobacteriaceae bacterium]|nr:16S rRNA (uracil(1498)-N(3))-methyltransferase [Flavobacteriaceae bacterium]